MDHEKLSTISGNSRLRSDENPVEITGKTGTARILYFPAVYSVCGKNAVPNDPKTVLLDTSELESERCALDGPKR